MNTVHVHTPQVSHSINDGLGVDNIIMTRGPVTAVHGVTQGTGVIAVNSSPLGPIGVTGRSQASICPAAVETTPTIF